MRVLHIDPRCAAPARGGVPGRSFHVDGQSAQRPTLAATGSAWGYATRGRRWKETHRELAAAAPTRQFARGVGRRRPGDGSSSDGLRSKSNYPRVSMENVITHVPGTRARAGGASYTIFATRAALGIATSASRWRDAAAPANYCMRAPSDNGPEGRVRRGGRLSVLPCE